TRIVDQVVEPLSAKTCQRRPDALHERVERADIARVEPQRNSLRSGLAPRGNDFIGFRTICVIGKDCVYPPLGEAEHSVAAESTAAAGDDRDLIFFVFFPHFPLLGTLLLASSAQSRCPSRNRQDCRASVRNSDGWRTE